VSDLEQLEFDDSMCCMPKNIGMLFFKQSLQVVHLAVMHSYFQTFISIGKFSMKLGWKSILQDIKYCWITTTEWQI